MIIQRCPYILVLIRIGENDIIRPRFMHKRPSESFTSLILEKGSTEGRIHCDSTINRGRKVDNIEFKMLEIQEGRLDLRKSIRNNQKEEGIGKENHQ